MTQEHLSLFLLEGRIRQIVREEIAARERELAALAPLPPPAVEVVPIITRADLLTEAEFCELVGCSRDTAWNWRKKRKLSFTRIHSRGVRYTQTDVQEFLKSRRRQRKPVSNKRHSAGV